MILIKVNYKNIFKYLDSNSISTTNKTNSNNRENENNDNSNLIFLPIQPICDIKKSRRTASVDERIYKKSYLSDFIKNEGIESIGMDIVENVDKINEINMDDIPYESLIKKSDESTSPDEKKTPKFIYNNITQNTQGEEEYTKQTPKFNLVSNPKILELQKNYRSLLKNKETNKSCYKEVNKTNNKVTSAKENSKDIYKKEGLVKNTITNVNNNFVIKNITNINANTNPSSSFLQNKIELRKNYECKVLQNKLKLEQERKYNNNIIVFIHN